MDTDAAAVAERYDRFARTEAPGRSALYGRWASGVADDGEVAALIARIAPPRRQPPLVFAVTRLLGAPLGEYPEWSRWLRGHIDQVVAECTARPMQTNEPLRCAALLPALSLIDGPIALLEVGASGGLCLYPDRYSYRYRRADGSVLALDPAGGPSPVVLSCTLSGERMPVPTLPEIVWRGGIDLAPLDAADPRDRAWLTGLVWPGEQGRAERMSAALDIVAADPPHLVAGDATEGFAPLVAQAAATGATVVVSTPGVLAHIPRARRAAVISHARAAGRWITIDAPALHDGWEASGEPKGWREEWPPGRFALGLDGRVLAAVDPLGAAVEWRRGSAASAG